MANLRPETPQPLADETAAAVSVASAVLWDDIEYAGVYRMLPKRFYRIAQAGSADQALDYYQWESIGADILIDGNLWIEGDLLVAEVRMHAVRAQENVFGRRYTAARGAARLLAHRIADDILEHAGNYQGVARTRIAFSTTRAQPRSKEIFLMDYDGHGQRPVTANGSLNITPSWSPDGRALSYISYREGAPALYLGVSLSGPRRETRRGLPILHPFLVPGRKVDRVHLESRRPIRNLSGRGGRQRTAKTHRPPRPSTSPLPGLRTDAQSPSLPTGREPRRSTPWIGTA